MRFVKLLSPDVRKRLKNNRVVISLLNIKAFIRGLFLYFRMLNVARRMKPSFIIIGAQKAGTTSLFAYLTEHPLIKEPYTKEVHYFDLNFKKSLNWYLSHFPVKQENNNEEISGEASPYYLFHPCVAERVKKHFPEIKIIALLREPVNRAYSQYHHENRGNPNPLSFEASIDYEMSHIAEEEQKLKEGTKDISHLHQHHSYISRSLYARQLERWLEHFSAEQILVVHSEELFAQPETVYGRVLDFLELPAFEELEFQTYNIGTANKKISDELRLKLNEIYFDKDQAKLQAILNDKRED